MSERLKKVLLIIGGLLLVLILALFLLARKEIPSSIQYGISYNEPYALELGLDPEEVFDAFVGELGVRDFRLSAHWTIVEPKKDIFDFSHMDRNIGKVEEVDGRVIFGVGRRLPRWPECHVPLWAQNLSWDEQKLEILEYIEATVNRYKDSPVITHWQIENEPYLEVFAYDHCGELDEDFLEEEIALVRKLDPTRPILVTDSGNLGTWSGAYKRGDAFGTSVYVYFWNPELGQFKTVLPPWFYRAKENVMELIYGDKETFLIELSLEPWLLEPVAEVPIDVQYSRMDIEKFEDIIEYAEKTRFEKQYLWGGEWWFWLKDKGHPEMWTRGTQLFNKDI